jgi:ABC-type Fe3+/spermidine/putrescine transport system ATPase subunit
VDCRKGLEVSGIELRSVSRAYPGNVALKEVSLNIAAGSHTAILGPSGCGKSTLLRMLAGLDTPSSGEVWIDGVLVSIRDEIIVPPHRRRISMVFQDLALWPNLNVRENVLLGLSGSTLRRTECTERVDTILRMCGVSHLSARLSGDLSGGEQQRVALARALGPHPRYLLLDEPFSSLDWITKEPLLRDIGGLASEDGITILLVTHDPIEATTLCPFAVILHRGCLVESGSFPDLLENSTSEIMRVFKAHL